MITAFHCIYGTIPYTGHDDIRPSIMQCMNSVVSWAQKSGHRYVLHTPDESTLEPNIDRRFAADLERIAYAAKCTPCIYFDWDVRINDTFSIPFPAYPAIGIPPIALFYLPEPAPAIRTLERCAEYKARNGCLHDNAVSDIFEECFWFPKGSYTHYNYHSLRGAL